MAKITSVDLPELEGATEQDMWQALIAIRGVIDNGDNSAKQQARQWLGLVADSGAPPRLRVLSGRLLNKLGDTRECVGRVIDFDLYG